MNEPKQTEEGLVCPECGGEIHWKTGYAGELEAHIPYCDCGWEGDPQ